MEVVVRMSSVAVALETKIWPAVVAKMALVAQNPLALLLLLICFEISLLTLDASGEDTRLPPGDLNGVTKCNAENKDGSATDDGTHDEEGGEDDDDDDMSTDDDEESSDDDDSDEDDSDDDDSDDSDDDDSDDDDSDDDEDDEEDGAPGKKKDQN